MKYRYIFIFLFIAASVSAQTGINAYEYWFDNDYASKVSGLTPVAATYTFNQNVPTTGLSAGLHVFHIRFKDKDGQWSSVVSSFFQKLPETNPATPDSCKITGYEYWVDSDYAGKTTGTTSATGVFHFDQNLDFAGVSAGLHVLHIRFQDDCGQWSSVVSSFFQKLPESTPTTPLDCQITGYEYWVDNGYANKVSGTTSATDVFHFDENLDFSNVSAGLHVLHIRFQDDCGQWSSVTSSFFQKLPEITPAPSPDCKITGYEYWLDTDYAGKTFMDVAPPEDVLMLMENLSLSGLTLGQHTFHIRFLDECGQWSSVCSDFFQATACTADTTYSFTPTCDLQLVDPANCTTQTFPGSSGCDSVVITCYEWLPAETVTETAYTCDPAQVGTTSAPVQIAADCWSLLVTNTVLTPSMPPAMPQGIAGTCGGTLQIYSIAGQPVPTDLTYRWKIEPPVPFTVLDPAEPTSISVFWETPGQYQISVAAVNGCGDTSAFSAPLLVEVFPDPVIEPIPADLLKLCQNDTFHHVFGDFETCLLLPDAVYLTDCTWDFVATADIIDQYQLSAIDTNGCESIYTFVIDVDPLPNVQAGMDGGPFCEGDSATLAVAFASPLNSYEWSNGATGPAISVSDEQAYTVTVTTSDGCTGTGSAGAVFESLPDADITLSGDCVLSAGLLSGNTYSWLLNGSEVSTAASFEPMENGEYTLVVTDGNGCTASSSTEVTCWTATEEAAWLESLRIFPNPNSGVFWVEIRAKQPAGEVRFEVFNALGQAFFDEKNNLQAGYLTREIDLRRVPTGIYFLKIEMDGAAVLRKITLDR